MLKSKSLSAQLINGCSLYDNDSKTAKRFEKSFDPKSHLDYTTSYFSSPKCSLRSSKSFSSMVKPNITCKLNLFSFPFFL